MRNLKNLTAAVITLVMMLNSCSFNLSTASVTDVRLCEAPDATGNCPADKAQFSPEAPMFYLSCNLNFAPEDTQIKFQWYNTDGKRYLIDEATLRAGDIGSGSTFNVHANLSKPTNGWPKGNYEVVVSLSSDNFKPISKTFTVM
ncbi:hypothetical protein C7N43_05970 [Sphingobacteriales bacterium UPWRP_1]|nr:hypothetical protein BVG80_05740 [Sphingobacteriales bacterium TSM_CSM]PSJ78002.1 hypothetical protein C7N43_05970 [Sphingobacteriales bacterium UPWRP_1]